MRYTGFFPSCLLPLASCLLPLASCLLPLLCSLFPVPCSLKPETLYLTKFKTAIQPQTKSYQYVQTVLGSGFTDFIVLP
ncbi:hypothetical protein [Moorena producens]|uniref:hypothetical protein n=1 Tax=Moorena producens TaxID=1155739 RepID=UPI003C74E79F